MIRLHDKQNPPAAIEQGQYLVTAGDTPHLSFSGAFFALTGNTGAAPFGTGVDGHAMWRDGAERFTDEVEREISVVSVADIVAVCDTVAEVNRVFDAADEIRDAYWEKGITASRALARLDGLSLPDREPTDYRAFTLLNDSGDSTITWDEQNDEAMEALIRRKMDTGMAFFIVPPKALGFIPRPKKSTKDVAELMRHRAVTVKDNDFAELIAAGVADVRQRPNIDTERAVQSHDPKEVSRSQSIGVMPMRGG